MSETTAAPESWRPCRGYEGYYEVSDQGRVRSLDRMVRGCYGTTQTLKGQLNDLNPGYAGYVLASLYRENRCRKVRVHTLVLEAFVGPCPPGLECLHRDGDPGNNQLTNLRWGTPSENMWDRVRHGRHPARNRATCPRSHALALPNLDPVAWAKGYRNCLACKRAHANQRYALQMGHAFDLQAKADWHYARIMADA